MNLKPEELVKTLRCIGCPMAGKHRKMEFERYRKIKLAYIRAFDRMLEERRRRGKMGCRDAMGR